MKRFLILIFMLGAFLSLEAQTFPNGGFELGSRVPFIYGDTTDFSLAESPVHSGVRSFYISQGWTSLETYSSNITITAGSTVTLTFWTYLGSGSSSFTCTIKNGSTVLAAVTTPTTHTTWVQNTLSFSSGTHTYITVYLDGPTNASAAEYFDDFVLSSTGGSNTHNPNFLYLFR